jgi:hypothetical protein
MHTTLQSPLPRNFWLISIYLVRWGMALRSYLLPVYDILLCIYREVLNPKVGCVDQIYGYLVNLLYLTNQHRRTHLQLDVMDYLWEEFWTCIMTRKSPVFAPYFMRSICSH